jgi:hypothetical protein
MTDQPLPIPTARFCATCMAPIADDQVGATYCPAHAPRAAVAPLSRPARKQMIATLEAANVCLAMMTKLGMVKAIEALARLTNDELVHATTWLEGLEPVKHGISVEHIDKLKALIESQQRMRPVVAKKELEAIEEAKKAKDQKQAEN